MDKVRECEVHYRIPAHPTEFADYMDEREIDIFVTEPYDGINNNTGIMLIIHAAGGCAEAAYFKKLRVEWANRYNVIALGVNYLGTKSMFYKTEFPEESIQRLFQKLTQSQKDEFLSKEERSVDDLIKYFENQDFSSEIFVYRKRENALDKEYCDYGFIQAMDCLYAIYYVLSLCSHYGIEINKKRIYAYGSSLGGYIAQMCLRFAPSTFSLVADNSGLINISKTEIFPKDYGVVRRSFFDNGMIVGSIEYQFYSQNLKSRYYFSPDMFQIRNLNYLKLLKTFSETCQSQIFMFQGHDDEFVNADEKRSLHEIYLRNNINSHFYCFTEKDVDGKIIKNSKHAMGADIKKLFEKYCDEHCMEKSEENSTAKQIDFDRGSIIKYNTDNGNFIIDYTNGVPSISFVKN